MIVLETIRFISHVVVSWFYYLLAIFLAAIFFGPDLKCLPLSFHARTIFTVVIRRAFASKASFKSLFKPELTYLRCPLFEVDPMFHKTNSSYFADMDESRLKVLANVFPECFTLFGSKDTLLALGGTSCTFYRSIMPLQPYELHTQILCWDEKWLYIASYFMNAGGSKKLLHARDNGLNVEEVRKKVVIAGAVSKYCFKKGRITVTPQDYLSQKRILTAHTEVEIKERIEQEMSVASAMADLGAVRESLKWL